jgi:hypothetical protein
MTRSVRAAVVPAALVEALVLEAVAAALAAQEEPVAQAQVVVAGLLAVPAELAPVQVAVKAEPQAEPRVELQAEQKELQAEPQDGAGPEPLAA